MACQGSFMDLIYPDESGSPAVMQYRIAFTNTPELLAVIHLRQLDPSFVSPMSSLTARDHVLNRIVAEQLTGIRVGSIRVAIEDPSGVFEFALEFDLHDYLLRGLPFDSTPVLAAGGRFREEFSIASDRAIAGSVRVHTAHATPQPLSQEVADAIV
jgi:hypothetical protein